jgi:excalibur calcium-binding domain-containing protein
MRLAVAGIGGDFAETADREAVFGEEPRCDLDLGSCRNRPLSSCVRAERSNRLYRIAMSYNRGLDRDKDRIACEKR